MNSIWRDMSSLKELENVWPLQKEKAQAKFNIEMLKELIVKSTLMDLRLTREWGQQQSSTTISRMVRQPAGSCPKGSWITAETIAITLTLNYYRHIDTEKGNVVVYCDSTSSLQFNLPYHKPPLGYRLTKALVPTSAWCQAIVALRIMR